MVSKNSEIKLALVGGGCAVIASTITAFFSSYFLDADTKQTTNVQLIQVAIGLLSKEQKTENLPSDKVIRKWAVDTINATAIVKFDDEAAKLLIDGKAQFSGIKLTAGGGLFVIPSVLEAMQGSIGEGDGPVNITVDKVGESFKLD